MTWIKNNITTIPVLLDDPQGISYESPGAVAIGMTAARVVECLSDNPMMTSLENPFVTSWPSAWYIDGCAVLFHSAHDRNAPNKPHVLGQFTVAWEEENRERVVAKLAQLFPWIKQTGT